MTATYRPFYSIAKHYQQFEKYLRDNTNPASPVSIKAMLALFPDAQYQQVASCFSYLKGKGLVGMMREGQAGVYWWKGNESKLKGNAVYLGEALPPAATASLASGEVPVGLAQPDICPNVEAPKVGISAVPTDTGPVLADNKPEIIVSADKVVVISKNVKITIEI